MGSRPNSLLFYGIKLDQGSDDWNELHEYDPNSELESFELSDYEVEEKLGVFGHTTDNYGETDLKIGIKIASGDWDADEVISLESVNEIALKMEYEKELSKLPENYQEIFRKYTPVLKLSTYYW